MRPQKIITDVTLSAGELERLDSWYKSLIADRHARVTPEDLVLNAKLKMILVDLENRRVVRSEAINNRYAPRAQHTGVERRSRVEPTTHRFVRPVLKAEVH
jgi:catechol-2,3-dioxygenase